MLMLSDRAALLSKRVTFKQIKPGDDDVTAMCLALSGIKLGEEEMNIILKQPRAHNILFIERDGGKFIQPVFEDIDPLRRKETVKGVEITFEMGSTKAAYMGCIMSKITLELTEGGDAVLSFDVVSFPPLRSEVLRLLGCLGAEIRIALHAPTFGEEKDAVPEEQGNLDLSDDTAHVRKRKPKTSNGRKREHRPSAH